VCPPRRLSGFGPVLSLRAVQEIGGALGVGGGEDEPLVLPRRSMRLIRQALGSTIIDPVMLTSAERLQYEGYRRREDAGKIIKALAAEGMTVKEIVRRVGASRNHVRDVIRNGCGDVFRSRQTSLAPYLATLDAEWMGGCRRGAELWRRLRRLGFPGSLRVANRRAHEM
jgi:hypothetical protein